MKLKEIDRTANVAWSPAHQNPIYLAAGTAAQQLDATFNTSATLELYALDLTDPGQDMNISGSINTESRVHKLVWSNSFSDNKPSSYLDLLIGGAEQGRLYIWDPAKILKKEDPLVHILDKHTGAVSALDINPFQVNLLASGAGDSEIYIWDLNNPDKPMTPGSKAQPQHDVSWVAWNKQVQHILASSHAGNAVVWDLRKNEPIIKIRDSMSRIKCKVICWHPDVATQLCIASEEDHSPVIQMWDLRSATSPLKLFENHTRGILSMAWSNNDSDLLLSSGKDNRIICWNPNSDVKDGEVVYELSNSNQWCFDVQWCPRNPALISGATFDGHVSLYSIMGGTLPLETSSKVADAFAGDSFLHPMPQHSVHATSETMLKKAPKWMKRPCGANFSVGGKLLTFTSSKVANSPHYKSELILSQVVTEPELLSRSASLENALKTNQIPSFCESKINTAKDKFERDVWKFIKVNFETEPVVKFLQLLGHNKLNRSSLQVDPNLNLMNVTNENNEVLNAFDEISEELKSIENSQQALKIDINKSNFEGQVTEALLTANFEEAVDVCLKNDHPAEALILASASGFEQLLVNTQKRILDSKKSSLHRLISSIVYRDLESIVLHCELSNWKETLVILLTYANPSEVVNLCNLLGVRLEESSDAVYRNSADLCYIVAGNVEQLVYSWNKHAHVNSIHDLQDLIEKVIVLQQSIGSRLDRQYLSGEHLTAKLLDYAKILSEQGCTETALRYLGNSNDSTAAILRDQFYNSLGYDLKSIGIAPPVKPFKVIDVKPEARVSSTQHIDSNIGIIGTQKPHHNMQGQLFQQSWQQGSHQSTQQTQPFNSFLPQNQNLGTPSYNQFSSGMSVPNYNYSQPSNSYNNPTFIQPSSITSNYLDPIHTYPSDAGTFGATSSHGGIQPTVKARGPLAKYHQNQTVSSVSSNAPTVNTFNPTSHQYDQPTLDPNNTYNSAYSTSNQPHYDQSNVQSSNQSNQDQHHNYSSTYQPIKAWNDPPALMSHKPQRKVETSVASTFEGHLYNPQEYQQQLNQQQQMNQQKHGNQQQHFNQQQTALNNSDQTVPVAPIQPVQKRQIPGENQVIKTIFNRLIELSLAKASNLPTKKKLDDVVKKMDIMYSHLSDGSLSQYTVSGLHKIISAIQQYDYNNALAIHSQIVSNGSFSEISSFIPGIKVLIQTAGQLQVYV